ncbi:MAG: VWA domain-containing protein [Vicinamibacterales bacterium]
MKGQVAIMVMLMTGMSGIDVNGANGLAADVQQIQPAPPAPAAQETPVFETGVELVSVAATVRDHKGRVVRDLAARDFEISVQGRPRPIVSFQSSDGGPISLALLVDVSGSMKADRMVDVHRVVDQLLSWCDARTDEAAIYTFDNELYEVEGFTHDLDKIRASVGHLDAFGMTSIFDAVGGTAKHLATRPPKRRAIVVLTDGQDNASRLTPADVSGLASAIDVPVYVVAVLSALDNPESPTAVVGAATSPVSTSLRSLAEWTGGEVFAVSAPAHASLAVRQLLGELRHQYLLAFEPGSERGWHRLDIRTRRPNLTVRARGGFLREG